LGFPDTKVAHSTVITHLGNALVGVAPEARNSTLDLFGDLHQLICCYKLPVFCEFDCTFGTKLEASVDNERPGSIMKS